MATPHSTHFYNEHAQRLFDQYQSLEFERVHGELLHHLPDQLGLALDIVAGSERDAKALAQRALAYVSLTRARKLAFVYGYGALSPWFVASPGNQ